MPITRRTVVGANNAFSFSLGSSVARDFGPLQSRRAHRAGRREGHSGVTFSTPDASADNIIDYFLIEPDGLDDYFDRSPDTTPQGPGSSVPTGYGVIDVADPAPGTWITQAMVDLTESGKEFTQTVTGTIAYDKAIVHALAVPDSASTSLAGGSITPVSVVVVNTTGIGRTFTLLSTNGDVAGPNVYIRAGGAAIVTATLTPTAASGTVVSGQIGVISNPSALGPTLVAGGYFFDDQTLALLPYEYTVS